MTELENNQASSSPRELRTLNRVERRIAGVLVEKAKTTPDAYPLSLNALVTGCNQKSNRDPQMELKESEVETTLEKLRLRGVVTEVQGGGRVPRYRHHLKDWLGVEGPELAVLTELLLRGAQSVGDLRSRAVRMAPGQIADLTALRPVIASLVEKGLMLELTPAGRGQIVSHNFYPPEELLRLRKEVAAVRIEASDDEDVVPAGTVEQGSQRPHSTAGPASHPAAVTSMSQEELQQLRADVRELRETVERLSADLAELRAVIS